MSKTRVYELARDLNVKSKDILEIAQRIGLDVKNHMSTLEEGDITTLKNRLRPGRDMTPPTQGTRPPASQAERPSPPQGSNRVNPQERSGNQPRPPHQQRPGDSQPAQQRPIENRPGGQQRPGDNRPASQPRPGDNRPAPQQRPGDNRTPGGQRPGDNRPAPQQRPGDNRPAPQQRPGDNRPAPQQRPGDSRPAPQQRPGDSRPAPQQRPGDNRPAPQQRPGDNRPAPQQRPGDNRTPAGGPRPGDNRPAPQQRPGDRPSMGQQTQNRPGSQPRPNDRNRPGQKPGFGGNRQRPGQQQGGNRPGKGRGPAPAPKPAEKPKPQVPAGPVKLEPINYTVGELEKLFNRPIAAIIKGLMSLGVMATINQTLNFETVEILAAQLGVELEIILPEVEEEPGNVEITSENAIDRAPVVTVMGHVDHGKTSLLDAIRNANVQAGEAGGITQHIGAYQVNHNGKKIVFLDTPGHEAFTSMRARGAKVTDMAILVVAADEGVMPQTIEALNHAKAAKVPIIVAMNKMDKAGANPDRVKQQLASHDLIPEDWGGNTIYGEVSAISGDGIEQLLEMILLVAEMAELKAAGNRPALGTVIEAKLDKGRGPVATVLIQHGELKVGDPVVCGSTFGRVRAMFSDTGQRINEAEATVPVEILGLSDVPPAGEIFRVVADERLARQLADKAAIAEKALANAPKVTVSLDDVFKQMQQSQAKELNLVLKSDVQGTTEALKQSLAKINVKDIRVNIVHDGVGAITSSDVMLASASGAIIIGFNVRPDTQAQKVAEEENVEIRLYRVIYNVIDDVKAALEGLLDPEFVEVALGRAEVRHLFKYSKLGTIAGCHVIDGKITSNAKCRLLRGGKIIFEGKLSSLKRFKEDVKDVATGYECGIMLENYNDLKEGDQIEAFVMKQK